MIKYAYIVNNQIDSLYDQLPANWRNISNFSALESDTNYLNSLGWQEIIKIIPNYDSSTKQLGNCSYHIENGKVYGTYEIVNLPSQEELKEQEWVKIRQIRDQLMNDFEWRYRRYQRETRMSIPQTDLIQNLDQYMQDLADITKQIDPFNIVWPQYNIVR